MENVTALRGLHSITHEELIEFFSRCVLELNLQEQKTVCGAYCKSIRSEYLNIDFLLNSGLNSKPHRLVTIRITDCVFSTHKTIRIITGEKYIGSLQETFCKQLTAFLIYKNFLPSPNYEEWWIQ